MRNSFSRQNASMTSWRRQPSVSSKSAGSGGISILKKRVMKNSGLLFGSVGSRCRTVIFFENGYKMLGADKTGPLGDFVDFFSRVFPQKPGCLLHSYA